MAGAQAGTFFADRAEGCVQASLGPGSTLLIPASWPHAVVTQEDAVVVGGNFLHALDLRCASDPEVETREGGKGLYGGMPTRPAASVSAEDVMQRLRCWADARSHPGLSRCRAVQSAQRTHDKALQRSWHGYLFPLAEVLDDWMTGQARAVMWCQAGGGVLGDGEPPEGARVSALPALWAADVAHRCALQRAPAAACACAWRACWGRQAQRGADSVGADRAHVCAVLPEAADRQDRLASLP